MEKTEVTPTAVAPGKKAPTENRRPRPAKMVGEAGTVPTDRRVVQVNAAVTVDSAAMVVTAQRADEAATDKRVGRPNMGRRWRSPRVRSTPSFIPTKSW